MLSINTSNQQESASGHRKHPCVLCQQRKVKCDRNEPCNNCTKTRLECVPASTLPPRKRKRRFPEAELLARLRRYEHHLKIYGADIDAINREEDHDDRRQVSILSTAIKSSCSESSSPINSLTLEAHDVGSLSVRRSLRHLQR